MILRKPYAFLIKHFKLIHILLTGLLIYIFIKGMNILTFFNEYISAQQMTTIVGGEEYLFGNFLLVAILIAIALAAAISALMFNKKKPLVFYFVFITFYLVLFIFYIYIKSQVVVLERELLDVRIIRMIRDILIAVVVLQFGTIIASLIRGVGFDVKKFNFKEDLEELDINDDDREEIEVAIEFDIESYKTKLKKGLRYFRYNLIENKIIVMLVSAGVVGFVLLITMYNTFFKNKIYKQGKYINPMYYSLTVKDSYLTQMNYQSKVLDDKYFVILEVIAKKNSKEKKQLDVARMAINIRDYKVYPTTNYIGSFRDLGYEYKDYFLDNEYNSYLLVYEVPKQFIKKKMIFEYTDIDGKVYRVRIKYKNLDNLIEDKNIKLKEEIKLDNTILKKGSFSIDSLEIADEFKIDYKMCVTDTECYDYYEKIFPDLTSNYDRTLIKLRLNVNVDEYYKNISNADFMNYFATVNYVVDGKKYTAGLNHISPKKVQTKNMFLSVNNNIKNASSINLEFRIRNYKYVYKVK